MAIKRKQLISTDEWVATLPEDQTLKYTYSDAVYTGTDNNIEITCPKHGNFWQRAYIHKHKSAGCPTCHEEARGSSLRSNALEFISKTLDVPEIANKYNYTKVIYKNSMTPVVVTCPEHGDFKITPSNHIAGKGCQLCYDKRRYLNNLSDADDFIRKSKKVHDVAYDYSFVNYENCKKKVLIVCPIHGPFWKTPDNHLQGQGCMGCAKTGYSTFKPGYLYVLTDSVTTKVGITNKSAEIRAKQVMKSGGPKLNIVAEFYFKDGQLTRNLEKACHTYLAANYKPVDATFDGSTECFLNVDLPALLNFISPLATEKPAATLESE